jgi:hypothetical protein
MKYSSQVGLDINNSLQPEKLFVKIADIIDPVKNSGSA